MSSECSQFVQKSEPIFWVLWDPYRIGAKPLFKVIPSALSHEVISNIKHFGNSELRVSVSSEPTTRGSLFRILFLELEGLLPPELRC